MKTFTITLKVSGCYNCPFSTDKVWCTKALAEVPTPEQVYKANVYKITETCPMFKEAK